MSSPSEDVSSTLGWLNGLFHLFIPTLPLSGLWKRFTRLWEMLIRGPLPPPDSPLPWTIDVEGAWENLLPGTALQLENIQIMARARDFPKSPDKLPIASPSLKTRKRSPVKKTAPKSTKRRQK